MPELLTRDFDLRAVDTEAREVSGIAVPYDTDTSIGGWYTERIARGAVQDSENALLYWRHDEPIGRITASGDTEAGWEITASISATPRGDEAYTLLKDGVIDRFSIGFESIEHSEDVETNTITRTKIRVREVSLVPFPAYEDATVSQVRSEIPAPVKDVTPVTDAITTADLVEVRESIEDLERSIATLSTREPEPVADTRSAGEVLKAIVAGTEDARAYAGSTTADSVVKNGWVGDLTRLVDEAAGIRALFATGTLPGEGTYVEYAQLKSNSVTVAAQGAEGTDLTFGKVQIETKTAPVITYGGYSTLSVQEIERSSVPVLNHTLRAQAIATGKALNTAFRAKFASAVAAQVTAGNTVELAGTDYADYLAAIVDAAEKYDTLGLSLDGLIVASDVFKALAALEASDGRPVLTVAGNNGVNTVGSINVAALSGNLATVPVVLGTGLTAGTQAFYNSTALRSYNSGAVALQDSNVINLSKDFSTYLYSAIADEVPAAIIPVEVA